MNIIPVLEIKGWRAYKNNCTGNQIVVNYKYVSRKTLLCEDCACKVQRVDTMLLTVKDAPHMQYDVNLLIETPHVFCPHCQKYTVIYPAEVHYERRMTLRLMRHIARLMRGAASAQFLSGMLRIPESCILQANEDIRALSEAANTACTDGRHTGTKQESTP